MTIGNRRPDAARMSRRRFMLASAAAGVASLPGAALAQNALGELLQAPTRGNWDDQFDTRASSVREVATASPIFSQNTLDSMQSAIYAYSQIVQTGGWPEVPETGVLKIGLESPAVAALRQRLAIAGDLPENAGSSTAFDTYVDAAVKRFQARHGLPADGVVSTNTFKAMNVPANLRLGQLQTNVSRVREMVAKDLGQRFVMVNIPAASIEAVENGRVVQRHTAIVGKVDRQTPILESKIINLNLNPYWHAPASIVRKDIIPLMQKDPGYLERSHIHIYDGKGNEIPPEFDRLAQRRGREVPVPAGSGRAQRHGVGEDQLPEPLLGLHARHAGAGVVLGADALRLLGLRARPERARPDRLARPRHPWLGPSAHRAGDRVARAPGHRPDEPGAGLLHLHHRLGDRPDGGPVP